MIYVVERWRCRACNARLHTEELLHAPSPFDAADILTGCPRCKRCDDGFSEMCDEPGCDTDASCGWPTDDGGYRRTCFEHSSFARR